MNDRTGGANAYYKRVAKKLHSMFRIVPIFLCFEEKGRKGRRQMDMGICSYNPQGDSRMEKVAAEGFKAKPLRRRGAKRKAFRKPVTPFGG